MAGFTGVTWRDAVAQSRPGEQALWGDAQQLTGRIAKQIGERPAVAWVHTAAVISHAVHYRLMPGEDLDSAASIRKQTERLASAHPALAGFADPDVNPMWRREPDAGISAAIGRLYAEHTVADLPGVPDGYRIGDLYQQLSEEARKGRALCQTPQWVTELLMDLSLDHAVDEAGWDGLSDLKVIDPACGTGHILVEMFLRLEGWRWQHPHRSLLDALAPGVLAQVHGVDLDPYAAQIARYRLCALAAAMAGTDLAALPPGLPVQVAAADSLLATDEPLLERGRYDVVVANPPYITVKDGKTNAAIRARYPQVCNGKYSLALPFHQLMNELLRPGGWCAQLTANSFMKREFGKRYVERYLSTLDLRWVMDTSGAYIPGHGTPTLILVNRNRPPVQDTTMSLLGVRGEPRVPVLPSRGVVWGQIRRLARERDAAARMDAVLAGASGEPDADVKPLVVADPARRAAPAIPRLPVSARARFDKSLQLTLGGSTDG